MELGTWKMELVQDIVHKSVKAAGHNETNCTIEEMKSSAKGDGFLGDILFVTVSVGEDKSKTLHLVIKQSFSEEGIRANLPIRAAYVTEVRFYTEIWPTFQKFLLQKLDPAVAGSINIVPQLYYNSIEDDKEYLVLQNLCRDGFYTIEKSTFYNDIQIRSIFKAYARFHALSFAYQDQHSEEFQRIVNVWPNAHQIFIESPVWSGLGANILLRTVYEHCESSEIRTKMKPFCEASSLIELYCNLFKLNGMICFTHIDCWSNNIMINHYNPREVRIIDWQLTRLASPVMDVAYVLYANGHRKYFSNYRDYIDVYYECFSQLLRRLGSKPEIVYPKSVMLQQWRTHAKYALINSSILTKLKLTKNEDVTDFQDGLLDSTPFYQIPFDKQRYISHMLALVHHLNDIDAL